MEPIIEICDVKKEYRLGTIGGTTLNAELQSFLAKLRGKEDPNKKIGAREGKAGERFLALDGVSFSVQPGEAVGIIGHNGAGKSTLLKLISRVTAPSDGEIRLRGRVASMLEVGTGFHPELTGRENVYLNGAILGMTKAEIDKKFDEIVEFAEMRQFIDTPVKRYSSGMHVKLAFSVAAHLDSEIMIMDEVLAVGDAKFQNKCLSRMQELAESGKAILYVSHNMNTIRKLCKRCVVLNKGHVVHDGDVDTGIEKYMAETISNVTVMDLRNVKRPSWCTMNSHFQRIELLDTANCIFPEGQHIRFSIDWCAEREIPDTILRIYFKLPNDMPVAFSLSHFQDSAPGQQYHQQITIDTRQLLPGKYLVWMELHEVDHAGAPRCTDYTQTSFQIEIVSPESAADSIASDRLLRNIRCRWDRGERGSVILPNQTVGGAL